VILRHTLDWQRVAKLILEDLISSSIGRTLQSQDPRNALEATSLSNSRARVVVSGKKAKRKHLLKERRG
jgi:malonyl CoA-acyl carrier protein transacylase